jgi:putative flippase GtrA
MLRNSLKAFIVPKLKFAVTSSVATLVDYGIYLTLTLSFLVNESVSHAISYSIGMIINFLLQRKFIFESKRRTSTIFAMSVMFSLIGWVLSQGIFNLLIYMVPFFGKYDILAKVVTTGTIFLYNFYTKRFSFERKIPLGSMKEIRKGKNEAD